MKKQTTLIPFCLAAVTASAIDFAGMSDLDFAERFAFSTNRAAVIDTLRPKTRPWYFYSILNAQNEGRLDDAKKLAQEWNPNDGGSSRYVTDFAYRHAFLCWDRKDVRSSITIPQALNSLGIYSYSRPREVELKPNTYPAELNQETISFKAFARGSRHWALNDNFKFLSYAGHPDFKMDGSFFTLSPYENLRPDTPGLMTEILKYLKSNDQNRDFIKAPLFQNLTLAQLMEIEKELTDTKKDVRNNTAFIEIVLAKLSPGADENVEQDDAAKEAWLARILDFSRTLAPAQSSLKLLAMYNLLDLYRSNGDFSHKDLFLEYIQSPRQTDADNRGNTSGLSAWQTRYNLQNLPHPYQTLIQGVLKPVSNEKGLLCDYLAAFRHNGSDLAEYMTWIDGKLVERVLAETDLLDGKPASTVATKAFTDSEFKALQERVDLIWSPANRKDFASDDAVSLDIAVKNISSMRLAIYDLDAFAACRQLSGDVPADIDLDACLPNTERTLDFSKYASIVRHTEHLDLPELKEPGLYVVECSGAGVCSRAVIRKGRLRVTERNGAGGKVFTAIDEKGHVVKGSKLWTNGTVFTADENGEITVPAVAAGAQRSIAVVGAGRLATTYVFTPAEEDYDLSFGVVLPAESLVAGKTGRALIATRLEMCGRKVPIELLEHPALKVTFTDIDGLSSVKTVENLKLSDAGEYAYSFQVPDRLASVTLDLRGTVKRITDGKEVSLHDCAEFAANGIVATETIEQIFLRRGADGYRIELRGRNGEKLPSRAVRLDFQHRAFNDLLSATLQANADGTVFLGPLDDIVKVVARCGKATAVWTLGEPAPRLPNAHIAEGETVEIPVRSLFAGKWPNAQDLATRVSLLARNDAGEFTGDYLEAVSYTNGVLRIAGLPAGDYSLMLRAENVSAGISVTKPADKTVDGGVIAGKRRGLSDIGDPSLLRISEAEITKRRLRVKLENAGEDARVHVIARRMVDSESNRAEDPFTELAATRFVPEGKIYTWGATRSDFVSGRNLGDKLRYILDRRNLPHTPGNMLARPSLLLTPWSPSETTTHDITLRDGDDWEEASAPDMQSARQVNGAPAAKPAPPQKAFAGLQPTYDFLPESAEIWPNLKPDKDGVVTMEVRQGMSFQDFTVIALDDTGADQVKLFAPTEDYTPRDLRFRSHSLTDGQLWGGPAQPPRALVKTATVLREKDIVIDKAPAPPMAPNPRAVTRTKSVRSTVELYDLLKLIGKDKTFDEFAFLAKWTTLPADEQKRRYGKYACHELDFFLYCRDRKFFDAVVKPNLKNKRFPQFMDRWLLGEDLSAYAEPGRLQNLNALEQCLLAKRIPALAPVIAKRFADFCEANPVVPEEEDRLFATAMDIADPNWAAAKFNDSAAAPEPAAMPSVAFAADAAEPEEILAELDEEAFDGQVQLGKAKADRKPSRQAAIDLARGNVWSSQAALLPDVAAAPESRRARGNGAKRRAAADMAQRKSRPFYRPPETTKEWVETHYYRKRHTEDTFALVPVNRFWRDYAAAIRDGEDEAFASGSVIFANSTLTEMIAALAVTAFPAQGQKELGNLPLAIVFSETEQIIEQTADDGNFVVIQRFKDPFATEIADDGTTRTRYVTDEFVAGKPYSLLTVVTNPSELERRIDVFRRIPEGAIALGGEKDSDSVPLLIAPYSAKALETIFYFPAAEGGIGRLPAATVTQHGAYCGGAKMCPACIVVPKATMIDSNSWDYISQNGTEEQVLDFLRTANLESPRFDLCKTAWRMRNADFRNRLFALLDSRGCYNNDLWKTALGGGTDAETMRRIAQLLARRENAKIVAPRLGPYLKSSVFTVEPEEADLFEHKEYWPLINARAHAIAGAPTIANNDLSKEYKDFLDILAMKPALTAKDRLLAAVFLLAQDRVADAKAMIAGVKAGDVNTKMQFDYLNAYLAFCDGKPENGRKIAEAYADYPVPLWRDRFREIIAQADEIAGKPVRFDNLCKDEAAAAPTLSLAAAMDKGITDQVVITARNLASCTLRAYLTDLEISFSKNPFGTGTGSGDTVTCLRPAWETTVQLVAGKDATVKLPEALRRKNFELVVSGADGRATARLSVSQSLLDVQVIREYGQLRVCDHDGKPLPGTYVKVYAKDAYGREMRFHKDGYTDLRGVFDYASVSTDSDFAPAEFAILVLNDQAGGKTLTVTPPLK